MKLTCRSPLTSTSLKSRYSAVESLLINGFAAPDFRSNRTSEPTYVLSSAASGCCTASSPLPSEVKPSNSGARPLSLPTATPSTTTFSPSA